MYTWKKELSQEESLFKDFWPLILCRAPQIIDTPEFYNCKLEFSRMANPHGAPKPLLGDLSILCGHGKFTVPCKKCGNHLLLVSGSGNLSGGISERTGSYMDCLKFNHEDGERLYVSIML